MRLAVLMALALLILLPAPQAAGQALPLPDFGGNEPPDVSDGPTPEEEAERADQEAVSEETGRATTANVSTTVSTVVSQALQPAIAALRAPPADDQNAQAGLRRRLGQNGSEPLFGVGAPAVWVSMGATFIDNDFAGNPFDGNVLNPLAGADITSPDGWVAGLSVGYEGSDLDTRFEDNDGTLDGDGFLIAPYAGYVLAPFAIVDASIGYARIGYDRVTRRGDARLSGSFDGDRFFAFTNLTGYMPQEVLDVPGLTLTGKVGFRYSREDQEAYALRGGADEGGLDVPGGVVELGTFTFGAKAAWRPEVGGVAGLELFARVEGEYDAIRSDSTSPTLDIETSDDRTGVSLGVGVVADVTDRISIDLSYDQLLSREDLTQGAVTAGLRMRF